MKKTVKGILLLFAVLVVSACAAASALAGDASVVYDGSAQKFLFAPGSSHSPTDLFDSFKGVMPGDTLHQKIAVRNDPSNQVKIKVYLRSLGAQDGSEDFLSSLNLTVTQDGDSVLFAAPADQTADLTDWVCLGTFYSGAEVLLDVKLEVPASLENDFQGTVGRLNWAFKVEELPVEPDDPKPPQTGGTIRVWTYAFTGAASLLLLLLLPAVNRRQKRERARNT